MQRHNISKEPINIYNSRRNLVFTKSWREGLKRILKIDESLTKRVLIPAYIGLSLEEGSGVFDPIISTKSEYEFYELDLNLNPVILDFKNKLINFDPTHVILINYFGWIINDRKEIFDLVWANSSAKVIEDWAHDLTPFYNKEYIDHFADYELFSVHKLLPVKDGGICVLKETNVPFEKKSDFEDIHNILSYDFNEIATKRIENYNFLKKSISGNKKLKIMFDNTGQRMLTPLNFPVIFSSKEERHLYYTKLIDVCIFPTALYHRLIPEIKLSDYPNSLDTSNTILNLPIHQDVGVDELNVIAEILLDE
jgi:dTDP-4-amino-4,6-dideoxygalactose transaminase